jgi:sugar/nucleoside kinase (ribokinase family)
VSERFCEQMGMDAPKTLDYLKTRGCRIGGVTLGERGLLWYDEAGKVQTLPALPVPAKLVIDTNGAGDVFHGAYVYSYLTAPDKPWKEHFDFARAASAFKVQRLGNEAGLPTVADIAAMRTKFAPTEGKVAASA